MKSIYIIICFITFLNTSYDSNVTIIINEDNSGDKIIKKVVELATIEKLPAPVELMNLQELLKWISPQIKLDIIEQGKTCISRIEWGSSKCEPNCWDNTFPWKDVSNPKQPQKNMPAGLEFVAILKQTVKNRLIQKELPEYYVSEDYSEEKDKKKKRKRGIHTAPRVTSLTDQSTEIRPISIVPLEESVDESSDEEELERERDGCGRRKLPRRDPVAPTPQVTQPQQLTPYPDHVSSMTPSPDHISTITPSPDHISSMTLSPAHVSSMTPSPDNVSSMQLSPISSPGSRLFFLDPEESFDIDPSTIPQSTISDTRILQPIPPSPIPQSSQPATIPQTSPPDTNPQISQPARRIQSSHEYIENEEISIENEQQIASRCITRAGTGKGGLKLTPGGGLKKPGNTQRKEQSDASGRRKAAWKLWLDDYKSDILAKVNNSKDEILKCNDCRASMLPKKLLRHKTIRSSGCTNIHPKVFISNWNISDFII